MAGFAVALATVCVSACAGTGEPSAPVAPRQVAPPKDFCASLDYAMVADRLGAKLLPAGPRAEQVDDFKLTCSHNTFGGSKHGDVGMEVTIIRFQNPELAEAETRGRAAQASPAPTGTDYAYVDSEHRVIAGARRGSYLTEVRLFPTQRPGDPMLSALAKEFLGKVTASLTP